MKPVNAQPSTMPTRRTALLLAAAALPLFKPSASRAREPSERWIHPALIEYDAITALADKEGCTEVTKRMQELRPQIAYLASLDPRD